MRLRRRRVLLAALPLVLVTGVALAAQPGGRQAIQRGHLRVREEEDRPRSHRRRLRLAAGRASPRSPGTPRARAVPTAPRALSGPQGPAGPAGAAGPKGDTGAAGAACLLAGSRWPGGAPLVLQAPPVLPARRRRRSRA